MSLWEGKNEMFDCKLCFMSYLDYNIKNASSQYELCSRHENVSRNALFLMKVNYNGDLQ